MQIQFMYNNPPYTAHSANEALHSSLRALNVINEPNLLDCCLCVPSTVEKKRGIWQKPSKKRAMKSCVDMRPHHYRNHFAVQHKSP